MPKDVLADAERIARHDPDQIAQRIDQVVHSLENTEDEFVSASARKILERTAW